MFEDLKDSKNGSSKNTKIPPSSNNYSRSNESFETYLNFIECTYVSRSFTIIQDLIRFHPRIFPLLFKTFGDANCFGSKKIILLWCPPGFTNCPNIERQDVYKSHITLKICSVL